MGRVSTETKQIKFFCFETVFIVGFMLRGVCPWIIDSTIYFQRLLQDHAGALGWDKQMFTPCGKPCLFLLPHVVPKFRLQSFLFTREKDAHSSVRGTTRWKTTASTGCWGKEFISSQCFKEGCRPAWKNELHIKTVSLTTLQLIYSGLSLHN